MRCQAKVVFPPRGFGPDTRLGDYQFLPVGNLSHGPDAAAHNALPGITTSPCPECLHRRRWTFLSNPRVLCPSQRCHLPTRQVIQKPFIDRKATRENIATFSPRTNPISRRDTCKTEFCCQRFYCCLHEAPKRSLRSVRRAQLPHPTYTPQLGVRNAALPTANHPEPSSTSAGPPKRLPAV